MHNCFWLYFDMNKVLYSIEQGNLSFKVYEKALVLIQGLCCLLGFLMLYNL